MEAKINTKRKQIKKMKEKKSGKEREGQHVFSTEDPRPPLEPTVSDCSTSASIWNKPAETNCIPSKLFLPLSCY